MFLTTDYILKRIILIILILVLSLGIINILSDSINLLKPNSILPIELNISNSKQILKHALPILGSKQQEPISYLVNSPTDLIDLISKSLLNIKISDPVSILDSELAFPLVLNKNSVEVASSEIYPTVRQRNNNNIQRSSNNKRQALQDSNLKFSQTKQSSQSNNDNVRFFQTQQSKEVKTFYSNVLAAVYHTHTSESYGVNVFNGHSAPGTKGDITEVGRELVKTLNYKYGIQAIQDTQVNDSVYRRAYFKSRRVGQRLVKENSNLKMVFDIHRDALAKQNKEVMTTTINGQKVARIMIVVAKADSDYGLSHPNWRKNLEFANRLADKMSSMYPGLLRKVKVVENRRYNQDIHPHALILEFGGVINTLPEVKRSARLMADVIASLLAEELGE
ncbi:stage II sporulation protein P [Selenihalanaerobacter shriftii]|uniref:Stage II sporulation protein P n=1 Tax=Selenihalanaerobacter shriftii TaxID=142842 RepID=A0A1T4PYL9_9FIRM|nr:stage II sporulation protein P [Selenihalanaerobacter shriftii]SJZ96603.1 stage II sporulation protein P [Selenihalanaerobacter shriftii]